MESQHPGQTASLGAPEPWTMKVLGSLALRPHDREAAEKHTGGLAGSLADWQTGLQKLPASQWSWAEIELSP